VQKNNDKKDKLITITITITITLTIRKKNKNGDYRLACQ
jgi:hypothetical protein